jgi:hypothetical protein
MATMSRNALGICHETGCEWFHKAFKASILRLKIYQSDPYGFDPLAYSILLLRDLMAPVSVELMRHEAHPGGENRAQYQPHNDPCNNA